ncbi:LysR family transcriptional regulator [Pseudomonas sp. MWU16-30317]|jgi:DNA-binding transcriptional LysR family regulator|uniref:LysR family transcriptional regulator n=1 Tax=Pseudomonas sp. MWU16-30317 TaxID=2878095 RepID=UPI001CF944B9|nr:LysR family transcriptional regulator [Pseudomonas sp. MWU16-30317]
MELHQLRCFVMVADELHFGRAARRLFMTQPPLSRQIQLLERSLGVTLLERSNRRVKLTIAGQHFLRDARHVLAYTEQAADSARRLERGEVGQLLLGFTAVSSYRMIPGLLECADTALPDVRVDLREMVSGAQIQALEANMLDIGFVRWSSSAADFHYQLISQEPLLVVMANEHPLAAHATIAIADLDQQPFVMYSPDEGRYFHDCIAGLFAMAGVSPRYRYYLGQTHSILGLVRAGLGVAIVPAAARHLYPGQLQFRRLRDADPMAQIYMVSRQDNDNPAVAPFIQMAGAYFAGAQRMTGEPHFPDPA